LTAFYARNYDARSARVEDWHQGSVQIDPGKMKLRFRLSERNGVRNYMRARGQRASLANGAQSVALEPCDGLRE